MARLILPMKHRRIILPLLAPAVLLSVSGADAEERQIDFNQTIRPILSDKCFSCHGPDAKERKAGLRLDVAESAYALRDGVRAIDREDPAKSDLLHRIQSADADEKMPPPESNRSLDPEEIRLLESWIRQGGIYRQHWAFIPPRPMALPEVESTDWPRNGIDHFVLERLEREGLSPSPPAARETLIRRVTFDLTGLPPSPSEVDAFVQSSDANAYEKLVDRLLRQERYGERMALAWMDAARYGDTSVMHADGNRDMWPWRDWVIRAYNSNLPFDRFTSFQIAGDLYPEPSDDQLIASGFNRNHATSDEGGAIAEELRVEYVVDRVKTTANVWMALTMECAQCHDHKYDPVSQRDYFRFFAYFNNTEDPGMQTRNGNQAPVVKVYSEDQREQEKEIRKWLEYVRGERAAGKPDPVAVTGWAETLRSGAGASDVEIGEWHQLGPFAADNPKQAYTKDFGPEKKVELAKKQGGKEWRLTEGWKNGFVHSLESPQNSAIYLARTFTGAMVNALPVSFGSDDGLKVWLNGKQILARDVERAAAADQDTANLIFEEGENTLLLKIINRTGASGFYFNMGLSGLPAEIRELVEADPKGWTEESRSKVSGYYSAHFWPAGLALDRQIRKGEEEEKGLLKAIPTSMVMRDRAKEPRKTFLLNRGQYDQPIKDEVLLPGVPAAILPSLPEDAPSNRLALAAWLTDSRQPLTARVAVNRYWTMFFGQGIVVTPGDFGNQGAWPSHPELLDWLAYDFATHGWDIKRTIKQIVISATYRQSSRMTPRLRDRDPLNRLVARGPRFRLQGEFIRDNALAVSGLLVEKIGGPGVKPYQPPRIWNEVSLNGGLRYPQDHGDKLYRRSLYTYWKRSAPMPNMLIFDAPTREKCVVARPRTNTPLQALVTLNDPQFVEAARVLAERMLLEGGDRTESRIDFAYRLVVARAARSTEHSLLQDFLDSQREILREDPEKASKLITVGEKKADPGLDPVELAAWTLVAQMILNLDECLTRG